MEMLTFAEHIHPRIAKLGIRDAAYAIRAREAVTEKFAKVFGETQETRAAHDGAMALLTDFENRADAYLAEQARLRQAQAAAEQQAAADFARAAAFAKAEATPMRPVEIVAAAEASGYRLRLRKGVIEIAPPHGLPLELEAQIAIHARELGDYLKSCETWRQIAVVPTDNETL